MGCGRLGKPLRGDAEQGAAHVQQPGAPAHDLPEQVGALGPFPSHLYTAGAGLSTTLVKTQLGMPL